MASQSQLEQAPAPQWDVDETDDRDYSAPELTVVAAVGELTTENKVSAGDV